MRSTIEALPASRIREVANAGLGRDDVLAFWFGESDEVTPMQVRQAAADALLRGETFYSHNLGLPELRVAIASYVSQLHGTVDQERIAVTSSGVSALMVAMQLLIEPGDEVVAVVPVWPNLTAQPAILGARVTRVALRPQACGRWMLDMDRLLSAITPATRVLLVNAPNNPTGWTLSRDEQAALLAHCRLTGTWILADEVYERLYFDGAEQAADEVGSGAASGPRPEPSPMHVAPVAPTSPEKLCAPSFLDLAGPQDRLIVAHSFSKSFLMTGWRLGWLVLPPQMLAGVGKLLEFNSSCAPVFVQRGAQQALAMADTLVPQVAGHLRACRDRLVAGLQLLPGVTAASPPGGMYAFFRIEGQNDSLALAKRLVAEQGLGLAPGVAFGDEAEGWLRWCYASADLTRLDNGLQRLQRALRL